MYIKIYIGSYKNNVMYVLRLVKKISIKNILVLFVRYTIHVHIQGVLDYLDFNHWDPRNIGNVFRVNIE